MTGLLNEMSKTIRSQAGSVTLLSKCQPAGNTDSRWLNEQQERPTDCTGEALKQEATSIAATE